MDDLIGSHYLSLPSQGNVYLSAKFRKKDGTNKMFVASARRKVYLVEYQSLDDYLEPVTKEIYFAYTSSGTEIYALDVLNRSRDHDDIVVGLIIIKNADGNNNVLLNLYSDYDLETSTDVILETIGQSCESFALDYTPYGLYHVELPPHRTNGSYENVWLIPGHDQKIRTYRNYYSERCHREINTNEFFPELDDTPSIVLTMEFLYYNKYHNRVTCLGCENGHVRCSIVDCDNNCVLKNLYVEYENPVSKVQLFTLSLPKVSLEQFLNTEDPALLDENPEINLLVVNSLYHSEVFMNIIACDLKRRHCLYENLLEDVCLCSTVADIDFDGKKEIIIGTYCEELILFKYMDDETWKCVDRKSIPNPIHSLYYEDMTDDGVSELIIVTSKGLHVYQHKLKQNTLTMLEDRMAKIESSEISETEGES